MPPLPSSSFTGMLIDPGAAPRAYSSGVLQEGQRRTGGVGGVGGWQCFRQYPLAAAHLAAAGGGAACARRGKGLWVA